MQHPKIKLFIQAGQSNMSGRPTTFDALPQHLQTPNPDVLWYGRDSWRVLQPIDQIAPWNQNLILGFGMELSAGDILTAHLNEPVGFVKYVVGGTNLAEDWNPISCTLYCTMRNRVSSSISALEAQNYQVDIAGFFWQQGESDALNPGHASQYETNLTQLFTQVRQDFGADLPIVYGLISPTKSNSQLANEVRTAQGEVDRIDANAVSVETQYFPKKADRVHWTSEGTLAAGYEFGEAWLSLQSESIPAESVPEPSSLLGLLLVGLFFSMRQWRTSR